MIGRLARSFCMLFNSGRGISPAIVSFFHFGLRSKTPIAFNAASELSAKRNGFMPNPLRIVACDKMQVLFAQGCLQAASKSRFRIRIFFM